MGYTYTNSRGETFYLFVKTSEFRDENKKTHSVTHYFYSLDKQPETAGYATACEMPDGYETFENPENGLPFVRKKGQ